MKPQNGEVGIFAFGNIRKAARNDQLQIMLAATKGQGAAATHIEFALHEWDAQLIRFGKGQDRIRQAAGSLPFPVIEYRIIRLGFAACRHQANVASQPRSFRRAQLRQVSPSYAEKRLQRYIDALRRIGAFHRQAARQAFAHQNGVDRIDKLLDHGAGRLTLLAADLPKVIFFVAVCPPQAIVRPIVVEAQKLNCRILSFRLQQIKAKACVSARHVSTHEGCNVERRVNRDLAMLEIIA